MRVYSMRECWLRAFMPALFENIFSLLLFVLAVDVIVFVVLGIHTCVLTDCSDLKSYSFKYRVRARGVTRASPNSETNLTLRRGSLTDICIDNNLWKFLKLRRGKKYCLRSEKSFLLVFALKVFYFLAPVSTLQFLVRDLFSSRTVLQPPLVPSPKTGTSAL